MGKKAKKKKGCLGLFINFIITVICLLITMFIFYLVYIVVTTDGPIDIVGEVKAIPDKLVELWNFLMEKIGQGGDGATEPAEPMTEPEVMTEPPVEETAP